MSLAIFYFTSYALNMFRTLIYPSSGACDCVDELPHRSSCSVKTDVLAISVPLRCVWCDVFCRLVVIGRCILIDFDRYILCFCDHCVRLCVVIFIVCLVFSAFLMYFVMWIWDCTYISSLCVGIFAAADIWWCSFCRLKHYCSVRVVCGSWGLMAIWNSGFDSPGYCSGISLSSR